MVQYTAQSAKRQHVGRPFFDNENVVLEIETALNKNSAARRASGKFVERSGFDGWNGLSPRCDLNPLRTTVSIAVHRVQGLNIDNIANVHVNQSYRTGNKNHGGFYWRL